MRTIKATIHTDGSIELLEPIKVLKQCDALVTVLEDVESDSEGLRPIGLAKGAFTVPDDFNEPLPDDILDDFEPA